MVDGSVIVLHLFQYLCPASILEINRDFDYYGFIVDCLFLLLWYAPQVPGAQGNFVFIKDAVYKKRDISLLPFPTYFVPEDEDMNSLKPLVADLGDVDPFMVTD